MLVSSRFNGPGCASGGAGYLPAVPPSRVAGQGVGDQGRPCPNVGPTFGNGRQTVCAQHLGGGRLLVVWTRLGNHHRAPSGRGDIGDSTLTRMSDNHIGGTYPVPGVIDPTTAGASDRCPCCPRTRRLAFFDPSAELLARPCENKDSAIR